MSKTKQRIYLMIGPVLFVLCCLAIPKSAFPALAERAAIGTVAWMAFWCRARCCHRRNSGLRG